MNFTALFGSRPNPGKLKNEERQYKRQINRSVRAIDREINRNKREQRKAQNETKRLAKQGQLTAVKHLCKDIVRNQQNEQQLIKLKADLRSLSAQMNYTTAIQQNTLKPAYTCYQSLKTKRVINLPELENIFTKFKMAESKMMYEMIDECMDDTMGIDDDDDDEAEELMQNVLDEIGIDLNEQLAYSSPPKCQSMEESYECDDSLSQRLAALSEGSYSSYSSVPRSVPSSAPTSSSLSYTKASNTSNTIGFSVGGSKDVGNFRKCIEQNRMPSINSITYNGLLYEYYFDTRTRKHLQNHSNIKKNKVEEKKDGSDLFYPSYCYAKVKKVNFEEMIANKNGNEYEYYMTLGLNSNIKTNEFNRKHLNLIIVLDISGSMGSAFKDDKTNKTKMEVANESVIALLKHLTVKDRFSLVTFQSDSEIVQPLKFINDINLKELKNKILSIKQHGGTDFQCGYFDAMREFEKLFKDENYKLNSVNHSYDNRVIFITDAKPNRSRADSNSLMEVMEYYSENKPPNNEGNDSKNNDENDSKIDEDEYIRNRIYTTFIGVGIDFNADLIENICTIRGCNYFTVKSTKDFIRTLDEEFEYFVTPLVFNVLLKLKCEGNSCKIEKVYGSNNKKSKEIITSGEISRINTLFPAKKRARTKGGGTRGGIQLIKLKKLTNDSKDNDTNINVDIEVSFEDRNGKKYKNKQFVIFEAPKLIINNNNNDMIEKDDNEHKIDDEKENFYDNTGIRKGILLCKYVEIIKLWIKDTGGGGTRLKINEKYKQVFKNFSKHFQREMKKCNDEKELQKEMEIMKKLINLV